MCIRFASNFLTLFFACIFFVLFLNFCFSFFIVFFLLFLLLLRLHLCIFDFLIFFRLFSYCRHLFWLFGFLFRLFRFSFRLFWRFLLKIFRIGVFVCIDLGRVIFSVIILIDFTEAFIEEIVVLGLPDVPDHFLVFPFFNFTDLSIF